MKKENRELLKASEFAFKNITILLGCVFIGVYADKHFNTKPLWIVISSLTALVYIICMILMLGSRKK